MSTPSTSIPAHHHHDERSEYQTRRAGPRLVRWAGLWSSPPGSPWPVAPPVRSARGRLSATNAGVSVAVCLSSIKMTDIRTSPRPVSPARLLTRRARVRQALPPLEEVLRGSLLHREIRCGKATCHCATGPGHPLMCVTVTFANGRTQQVTVPREWRTTVQRWIANYQRYWQAIEAISAINRQLLQRRQWPATPASVGAGARGASPKAARRPGRRR